MNKIISRGAPAVASFVLAAYAISAEPSAAHATRDSSPTDPFRINMGPQYGPTFPSVPKPPPPAKHWVDVTNWQRFLKSHWFALLDFELLDSNYPTGVFDAKTERATRLFQRSIFFGDPIAKRGVVNWATYYRAVRAGMPAYTPVFPHPMHVRGMDCFRMNLTQGDGPNGNPPGSQPPNGCPKPWNDVTDWQNFLMNTMGYIDHPPYPTGTFDPTTTKFTTQFQHDATVSGALAGKVDKNTFNAAEAKPYYMQTYSPVSHP
jgi:peptidoglycan hydrolase-like protein with peptidoglycan-binding domain